eukprot:1175610-Prorocentrum_minimum.AAC.1
MTEFPRSRALGHPFACPCLPRTVAHFDTRMEPVSENLLVGPLVTEVEGGGQNPLLFVRHVAVPPTGDAVIVGMVQHQRVGHADVVRLHESHHRDADAAMTPLAVRGMLTCWKSSQERCAVHLARGRATGPITLCWKTQHRIWRGAPTFRWSLLHNSHRTLPPQWPIVDLGLGAGLIAQEGSYTTDKGRTVRLPSLAPQPTRPLVLWCQTSGHTRLAGLLHRHEYTHAEVGTEPQRPGELSSQHRRLSCWRVARYAPFPNITAVGSLQSKSLRGFDNSRLVTCTPSHTVSSLSQDVVVSQHLAHFSLASHCRGRVLAEPRALGGKGGSCHLGQGVGFPECDPQCQEGGADQDLVARLLDRGEAFLCGVPMMHFHPLLCPCTGAAALLVVISVRLDDVHCPYPEGLRRSAHRRHIAPVVQPCPVIVGATLQLIPHPGLPGMAKQTAQWRPPVAFAWSIRASTRINERSNKHRLVHHLGRWDTPSTTGTTL